MSHARIAEMFVESGLDYEDMNELVDALAPLDDLADERPVPSADLEALLASGARPAERREGALLGARRGAVVSVVVLALSGVGATGLSAAANTLPAPLQHRVSEFSRHYLPFDLPEPPAPEQPLGAGVGEAPAGTEGTRTDKPSRSVEIRRRDHGAHPPRDRHADTPSQVRPEAGASPNSDPAPTTYAPPSASPTPTPTSAPSPSEEPEGPWTETSTGKGKSDKSSTPKDRGSGKQESGGDGKGKGKDRDADQKPDPDAYEGVDGNAAATMSSPVPDRPAPDLPAPDLPVPSTPLATPAFGRDVTGGTVTGTN